MSEHHEMIHMTEEQWRAILMGIHPGLRRRRHLFRLIPSSPRCKFCNAPFKGPGAPFMKLINRAPYRKNPNFCGACLVDTEVGGVEIEISMLFADVRDSTVLAEQMTASEFSRLMNRFYGVSTAVLLKTDALIDKLVGDEVIGLYIPGFSGPDHARLAVEAAQEMLRATGHQDPQGPWISIGIGVHTGTAFVGLVGTEGGISDLTALGDAMNTTARLASVAGPGEALISEAALQASGLELSGLDRRELELKGKQEKVTAHVFRNR